MSWMTRAAFPAAILLLASCSDRPVTQKADLQQAAEAAKVAGDAEAAQKYAPMRLGPPQEAVTGKPSAVAGAGNPKPQLTAAAPNPTSAQRSADAKTGQAAATEVAQPITPGAAGAQTAAAQPIAAGPVPAFGESTPVSSAMVVDTRPTNGTAIHLASYREITSAQRGWEILSRSYHELAALKPLYVAVDVPGKGRMLRLYGTGADTRTLKEICHEIQAAGAYCADNIAY